MEQANVLLKKTKFAQALDEVSRIFALDPSHEEALALQHAIRAAQAEHDRRQEEVHRLQEEQKRRLEEVQSRLKEQEQKARALQKERAAMEETVAQRIANRESRCTAKKLNAKMKKTCTGTISAKNRPRSIAAC